MQFEDVVSKTYLFLNFLQKPFKETHSATNNVHLCLTFKASVLCYFHLSSLIFRSFPPHHILSSSKSELFPHAFPSLCFCLSYSFFKLLSLLWLKCLQRVLSNTFKLRQGGLFSPIIFKAHFCDIIILI